MIKNILFIGFLFFYTFSFAQKGLQGFGVDYTFLKSYYEDFSKMGINLKYQYALSNHFRIEGIYTFCTGPDDEIIEQPYFTMGDRYPRAINLLCSNIQWVMIQGVFKPYITTGIGLCLAEEQSFHGGGSSPYFIIEDSEIVPNFVYNLGVGFNTRIARRFELHTEIKYQLICIHMWSIDGFQFSTGFSYLF